MKLRIPKPDYDLYVARNRFLAGLGLTFFVVIAVPLLVDYLLQPILNSIFGDGNVAFFSSSLIVTLLITVLAMLMKMVGSGSSIFNKMGIPGIIGLFVAYWFMDNLWGATMPILSMLIVLAFKNREIYLEGLRD